MNNLQIFFLSQLFSGFAYELFHSSVAFYVLSSTGSPIKFALIYFSSTISKMIFLQVSGLVVDRFNRKNIFVLIDFMQSIYFGIIFYLIFYSKIDTKYLTLFTFISGIFKAFTYPSTKAVVPLLAKDKSVVKASSFEISNDKMARTLAPNIALLMFAKGGITISILISSILFLISGGAKSLLKIENIERKKESVNLILFTGIKSLFKSRIIIFAWLNAVVTQFIFNPFLTNVIPNILKATSDANTSKNLGPIFNFIVYLLGNNREDFYLTLISILGVANTIGVFLSLLWFQVYGKKGDERLGMRISTIMLIISSILSSYLIYYVSTDPILLTLLLFPVNILFYFTINTYTVYFTMFYQSKVPKENMGRFVANLMTIFMGVKSFGHLIYGKILEKGFFWAGVILISASIVKWLIYRVFEREYDNIRM